MGKKPRLDVAMHRGVRHGFQGYAVWNTKAPCKQRVRLFNVCERRGFS